VRVRMRSRSTLANPSSTSIISRPVEGACPKLRCQSQHDVSIDGIMTLVASTMAG
jgi:hypothetical protein